MHRTLGFPLAGAALALIGLGAAQAADPPLDPEIKARIEQFEKGPATVDVSKYPEAIQDNYQVFAERCAQCHKLSRAINSDYALPAEWERYVKRMMYKPGSGISRADGKKIFDFLVYDSSVRKQALADAKLASATPAEKAAAESKLKEIRAKYDSK